MTAGTCHMFELCPGLLAMIELYTVRTYDFKIRFFQEKRADFSWILVKVSGKLVAGSW